MLLSMAKVHIIGTKPYLDKTIHVLQRLGAVQISEWRAERATSQQRLTLSEELGNLRERLASMATQVDSALTALPDSAVSPSLEYEDEYVRPADWLLEMIEDKLAELEPQLRRLTRRQEQLKEEFGSLTRYEITLARLAPLLPTIVDLERYRMTAIIVERRHREILETITQQLEELTNGLCEVESKVIDQDTLAAVLVYPSKQADAVNRLLGRENVSQMRLPTEFSGQSIERALANMRRRLEVIPAELTELKTQRTALAETWRPRLLAWQALLRDHREQINVRTDFGQTNYIFVIEGWIPERGLAELETVLQREVGDEVVVTAVAISDKEKEQVPVMFDNPPLVKPFEPLVELLSLPRHRAFDPTPLMSLFLPLFYGMILGDIGYGIILLALMLALRWRFEPGSMLRSLTEVLMIGSVWSIVFGFMYGEFFGTLGERFGLRPLWFNRGQGVEALFLLTLGVGVGHIVLGLGLGAWEALRHGQRNELLEKAAMLISLAALFALVAVLAGYLPDSFFTPAIAVLVVGVVVLGYSMGRMGVLLGPLELLGVVGNMLSYLRIAAVGLASVYLAQVANELAGSSGNVLVGVIIAVLIHGLNIVLGAFSPTIQSLRLHYVEFFDKFYEGGGESFRPFKRSVLTFER